MEIQSVFRKIVPTISENSTAATIFFMRWFLCRKNPYPKAVMKDVSEKPGKNAPMGNRVAPRTSATSPTKPALRGPSRMPARTMGIKEKPIFRFQRLMERKRDRIICTATNIAISTKRCVMLFCFSVIKKYLLFSMGNRRAFLLFFANKNPSIITIPTQIHLPKQVWLYG